MNQTNLTDETGTETIISSFECTGNNSKIIWSNYASSRNIWVLILGGFIIIANSLLIFVILKSKGLRSQRFNLIMISLAFTDLLVGIFSPFNTLRFPTDRTTQVSGFWTMGQSMCQFANSMVVMFLSASIYNFVAVNLDRLLAIKFPLMYRDMREKRWAVKLAIGLCWLLALVPTIPLWIPDSYYGDEHQYLSEKVDGSCTQCGFPYKSDPWVWWAGSTAFIIPTALILVIWAIIVHHLHTDTTHAQKSLTQGRKSRERKITIVMGVITLTFLICWWPYAIIFMTIPSNEGNMKYLGNVVLLSYTNSLINPLLYISINKQVRDAVRRLLTCQDIYHRSEWSSGRASTLKKSFTQQRSKSVESSCG